jgi:hypothetical protein
MSKTVYFTSFPRTGTHTIGINMHKFYDVVPEVFHDTDNFDNDNVISVVRDPLENIASYYVHHILVHNQEYNLLGLANAALDYLNYYDEAMFFPQIVYADFNLLANDFTAFADKVADIFDLKKSDNYANAHVEMAVDDYRGVPWKSSVVNTPEYKQAIDDLSNKIGLHEQYQKYNSLIEIAKIK